MFWGEFIDDANGESGEGVVNVELAGDLSANVVLSLLGFDVVVDARGEETDLASLKRARVDAVGKRIGDIGDEKARRRIVGVDNAGLFAFSIVVSKFEEATFGVTITLEGSVIVKVLVSDISHDGEINRNAGSAVLGECMAGDFENKKIDATISDRFDALIEKGGASGSHMFGL